MPAAGSRALHGVRMVLMGAPGAGKGTFAKVLGPHFNVPVISTGNLIRAEIGSGSAMGAELRRFNDAGKLVPDEVISEIARKRLSAPDAKHGFILDGYPRTLPQARLLARFAEPELVLNVHLEESVLVQKMSSRRVCVGCGSNYNLSAIKKGDIDMAPLLPKVPGQCDEVGCARCAPVVLPPPR
jgi:adenylate kinase